MNDNIQELIISGKNHISDWHDTDMPDRAKDIISGMVAITHFTIQNVDLDEIRKINCIRVALESAYQLGKEEGINKR